MSGLRPKLALVARIGLGGLFVYAGALKAMDPEGFAQDMANYRLIPEMFVGSLAVMLPGVEIAAGLSLVTGVALRGGIVVIEAMLAVFVIALAQAIHRGIDTSCGCFGFGDQTEPVGWGEVVRDLAMMAAGWLSWPGQSPVDQP